MFSVKTLFCFCLFKTFSILRLLVFGLTYFVTSGVMELDNCSCYRKATSLNFVFLSQRKLLAAFSPTPDDWKTLENRLDGANRPTEKTHGIEVIFYRSFSAISEKLRREHYGEFSFIIYLVEKFTSNCFLAACSLSRKLSSWCKSVTAFMDCLANGYRADYWR